MINNTSILQDSLRVNRIGALLVSNPYNIRYFSDFQGLSPEEREAFFLVTKHNAFLIVPRLYEESARILKGAFEIVPIQERGSFFETITEFLKKERIANIGFEERDLRVVEYGRLKKGLKLRPAGKIIENIRLIKAKEEIAAITRAQKITKRAYTLLVQSLRAGDTERELSFRVKKILADQGSEAPAFEPIVATSSGSALPHYMPGLKRLGRNEILLIDIGATYKGYRGDLTRTIWFGRTKDSRFQTIYRLVQKAQRAAIKNIKPGMRAGEAHELARRVFAAEGFAENFIHGLGHGIGLEVHEPPHLRAGGEQILQPGMVFSIEPGLYFPGWGGVRIEDLALLTELGCEILP
jgi:Xaa-Pro aminopeptidase